MNRLLFISLIVSLACTTADSVSPRSVVLKADSAEVFKTKCWGEMLSDYTGTWVLDEETVRDLESNLGQLGKMLHKRGCGSPSFEPIALQYQFQYVGVIIGGGKMVFVNGFVPTTDITSESNEPNTICSLVNDGGCSFFGALYDPAAKTFVHFDIAPIA